jgi:hypothetical protein
MDVSNIDKLIKELRVSKHQDCPKGGFEISNKYGRIELANDACIWSFWANSNDASVDRSEYGQLTKEIGEALLAKLLNLAHEGKFSSVTVDDLFYAHHKMSKEEVKEYQELSVKYARLANTIWHSEETILGTLELPLAYLREVVKGLEENFLIENRCPRSGVAQCFYGEGEALAEAEEACLELEASEYEISPEEDMLGENHYSDCAREAQEWEMERDELARLSEWAYKG